MTISNTNEKDEDRLLNSKEVAEFIGISVDAVNKLAINNTIPCIKIGNKFKYRMSTVNKFKEFYSTLLNRKEAAEFIGISVDALAIRYRQIPYIKINGKAMYKLSDINAFIEAYNIIKEDDSMLLSRKEAAHILGVTEGALAVWACNKRYSLPYVKIGGRAKYKLSDINALIEKRTFSRGDEPCKW